MRRTHWASWQLDTLRFQYPHMVSKAVAIFVGRDLASVYAKAAALGLKKTDEFLATPAACRVNVVTRGGPTRFKPGHASWNKGLKGWSSGGRTHAFQFRKGQKPHNWVPIGTERISKDGYRERKVTDTGYPPHDWKGIHRLNWIEANGPIPAGHCVAFKDGNKLNTALANLELRSLRDNMARNTIHRLPKDVMRAYQLVGALQRQINRRTKA